MRLAILLVLAIGCSSQPDKATPSPTPTPTPSPTPTETPAPAPAPTPAGGADCATDDDCTTTPYAPEPVKDASGCCAALACPRVETARRARELADAWTGACAAVRCRAPDCPAGNPEPNAGCKDGRCAPR